MYSNIFKRIVTSFFLIFLLIFGLYYSDITWKTLVIIFSALCFFEFYNLIKKIHKNNILKLFSLIIVGIYLFFFYFISIKIRFDFGEELILILLIACINSDIGGYVIGKKIGGPKLTKLSPNKTISGAIGSIIFTVIGIFLLTLLLNKIDSNLINIKFTTMTWIWLVLMSIFCQIGDLLISFLKRKAKVKDTGNILPGHGGILDRVDGILFAIPFGFLTYLFLK